MILGQELYFMSHGVDNLKPFKPINSVFNFYFITNVYEHNVTSDKIKKSVSCYK